MAAMVWWRGARLSPRLRQWLAYGALLVSAGASVATSDCASTKSRAYERTVVLPPGDAGVDLEFVHNGIGATLVIDTPVPLLVEVITPETQSGTGGSWVTLTGGTTSVPVAGAAGWGGTAGATAFGGAGALGSAGALGGVAGTASGGVATSSGSSSTGGAELPPGAELVSPGQSYVSVDCWRDCSPMHVRLRPWQMALAKETPVQLSVWISGDESCEGEYSLWLREE